MTLANFSKFEAQRLIDTQGRERYSKQFISNRIQLEERIDKMKRGENPSHTKIGFEHYIEQDGNSKAVETVEISRRNLIHERLKAIPDQTLNYEQLLFKAQSALAKAKYAIAVKHFSYCIDLYTIQVAAYAATRPQQCEMAKLFACRAQCNLHLAKLNRSEKDAKKVCDDALYILEVGLFEAITTDESAIALKQYQIEAMDMIARRRASAAETTETANQRRRRLQRERQQAARTTTTTTTQNHLDFDFNFDFEQPIEAHFSTQVLQLDHRHDDECPICFNKWRDFIQVKIVAVLPCGHACCAKCLLEYHAGCVDPSIDVKERGLFSCPLCRLQLSNGIFRKIAILFLDYFNPFTQQLSLFSHEHKESLVISLLLKYKFNLSKVEYALFNMIGLVEQNPNETFKSEDKQTFYNSARAPIKQLRNEISIIKSTLYIIDDIDSEQGQQLRRRLGEVNKSLQMAMHSASRDIFERVNSKEHESSSVHSVDLHGLHTEEAKEIVSEYVLPVLKVVERIMIITGRGVHSASGKSVLRDSLKEYFMSDQVKIQCQDVERNDGAFYIFK
jgi:DNA-nicking Smr family endonuclease